MRNGIQDFSLANPIYANALVNIVTVDGDGVPTATKATLYAGLTGTATLTNPQRLDSQGKFRQPAYVEVPVVAQISGLAVPDHSTGVINAVLAAGSAASIYDDFASIVRALGSNLVGYRAPGTDTQGTTVESVLDYELVSIFRYLTTAEKVAVTARTGAVDVTLAMKRAADELTSGQELVFPPGVYVCSFANAGNQTDFGRKVMYLNGKSNIRIRGVNAEIRVVNHDIAANGGLMWLWATACQNVTVEGFYFNMTFTGAKDSASYYPFVGAIIFDDGTATGVKTQSQLNGDITVRHCRFKLYHPYGQYAVTTHAYAGDTNNGYKMFAVTALGDYLATSYASQNRNLKFYDIRFEDGHNGYGVWAWAFNHVKAVRITAEAFVAKRSNAANGTYNGVGVPMIRYHQWHCSGLEVTGCDFRAKPSSERLVAGFEGVGLFLTVDTNLTGDYLHGRAHVHHNDILLGNGDAAHSGIDQGITVFCYGDVIIDHNGFNGHTSAGNDYVAQDIYYGAEPVGGSGIGSLTIDHNTFGVAGSYHQNIIFANGAIASEYDRRCKSLIVTNNTSHSQFQYFLDMVANSASAYLGCRKTLIAGNTVVGTYNTVYDKNSVNSRAFNAAGTEAADILIARDNIVVDKYYAFLVPSLNTAANASFENNQLAGVTVDISVATFRNMLNKAGTFTPTVKGSTADGAGTYTLRLGSYQRYGTRCKGELAITITAHTGTGNIFIDLNDLPYTIRNINAAFLVPVVESQSNLVVGAGKRLGATTVPGTKQIYLTAEDDTGGAAALVPMDTAFTLYMKFDFEVA